MGGFREQPINSNRQPEFNRNNNFINEEVIKDEIKRDDCMDDEIIKDEDT